MRSVENVECFVFDCCFVLNRARIYFGINEFMYAQTKNSSA